MTVDPKATSRRVLPNGRPAPELPVLYRCPKCGHEAILDAYRGVPSCTNSHVPVGMDPVKLATT